MEAINLIYQNYKLIDDFLLLNTQFLPYVMLKFIKHYHSKRYSINLFESIDCKTFTIN